jgi:hypothetical protein
MDSPLEEAGLELLVPSPGLVPIALSKMTRSHVLASRNEHWPTLPSVGNQVNTAA